MLDKDVQIGQTYILLGEVVKVKRKIRDARPYQFRGETRTEDALFSGNLDSGYGQQVVIRACELQILGR